MRSSDTLFCEQIGTLRNVLIGVLELYFQYLCGRAYDKVGLAVDPCKTIGQTASVRSGLTKCYRQVAIEEAEKTDDL